MRETTHLHLVGISKILQAGETHREGRHRATAGDPGLERLDLTGCDEGFVGLDVDHVVGADAEVGLGDPVGAARMLVAGQHRLVSQRGEQPEEFLVIDRKMQRQVGRLRTDALRHPDDEGLAPDFVQQLAGKAH